ncbi:MAG: hypothetical protein F6J90_04460 [Moorea sp. SIOASIH]|uniref:hypothetical protein n=1 Tax=Moorena sp. SIOASIH TaxID=2607817 RepID=UPI0013B6EE4E|nr:hypothetical protein [Moorena sp. SIOASIH]NEO35608.1 hypothetical protein [Moorena sp. SIOASIH]
MAKGLSRAKGDEAFAKRGQRLQLPLKAIALSYRVSNQPSAVSRGRGRVGKFCTEGNFIINHRHAAHPTLSAIGRRPRYAPEASLPLKAIALN